MIMTKITAAVWVQEDSSLRIWARRCHSSASPDVELSPLSP
jgi:hypothetical protein